MLHAQSSRAGVKQLRQSRPAWVQGRQVDLSIQVLQRLLVGRSAEVRVHFRVRLVVDGVEGHAKVLPGDLRNAVPIMLLGAEDRSVEVGCTICMLLFSHGCEEHRRAGLQVRPRVCLSVCGEQQLEEAVTTERCGLLVLSPMGPHKRVVHVFAFHARRQ